MNRKNAQMGAPSAIVFFALVVLIMPSWADAGDDPDFSSKVMAATGKIRVEWRSMGDFFPGEGIGFSVYPGGYIVTALDVVADPAKSQGQHRSSSRLILMTFAPWGQNQRFFSAKLIAKDRRRNLALLKVDLETTEYLEVSKSNDLNQGDPIWVVEAGRLRQGDVGEKEIGSRGRQVGFATSFALATDGMGGPIIDQRGEVVGVRMAHSEGRRESRSIPTRWLADFLNREKVYVSLDPAVITDLTQPMRVRLDPVMVLGTVGGGRIEIDLVGQRVEAPIVEVQGGWEAEITLPAIEGGTPEDALVAKVVLTLEDQDGQLLWTRRAKVDVISLVTSRYQQQDGPSLQEREVDLGKRGDRGEGAEGVSSGNSLADVAGSVNLKKDAPGVAKIEATSVQGAGDARPDPARYEGLEDNLQSSLAERFDVIALKISRKKNIQLQMSGDRFSQEEDLDRLAVEIEELKIRRGKLVSQILGSEICQCPSMLWFPCAEAACNISAFQSGLVDYTQEAQEIVKAREEAKNR